MIEKDIDEINGHNWWCETEKPQSYAESDDWEPSTCNFPFKLNGKYIFKPFKTCEGDEKCIVAMNTFNPKPGKPNSVDWNNPKVFNESELINCSPCPGKRLK